MYYNDSYNTTTDIFIDPFSFISFFDALIYIFLIIVIPFEMSILSNVKTVM